MNNLPAIGEAVQIISGEHRGKVGRCVASSVCSPLARQRDNFVDVVLEDGRSARLSGKAVTAVSNGGS